jgi:glutamine amidotransferase-like uncharacterized protein
LVAPTAARAAGASASGGDSCSACVADFALYDPNRPDDGVWDDEVTALEAAFDAYGFTHRSMGAGTINDGGLLTRDGNRRYRALIAPGGYAFQRKQAVNSDGDAHIRKFVRRGGNYVGFCAGAYWATGQIDWAERATGGGGTYNRSGDRWTDYAPYAYDLGLFDATAMGPFGWVPWNGGKNASYQVAAIDTSNAVMRKIGLPANSRFYYGGGPVFTDVQTKPRRYDVWAKAMAPPGTSAAASAGNGEPAIVRVSHGRGDVILFSYHPAILIHSKVDDVKLSGFIDEDDYTWDTGEQTQSEVNLQSWNILHAALQVAANERVSPITSLPK